MNKSRFLAAAMALATGVLAGCAAAPSVTEDRLQVDVSKYSEVQVRVDSEAGVREQYGYHEVATQLLRSFVDALRATGKFATVGMEGAAPDSKALDVRLNITGFNYVSSASRAAQGILAGRAVLNVSMVITDAATKEAAGIVSARHESSHGQGVFSPSSGRQAEAIGKELAGRLATSRR